MILTTCGCPAPGGRLPKPALAGCRTLGRVSSERPSDQFAGALAKHAGWPAGRMQVREVLVMGSELSPKGPVYTVMGRGKLQG